MNAIYTEEICENCLQWLVNNESDHTKLEFEEMQKTLKVWAQDKYVPAGLCDISEPFFSHSRCILCNCLAGTREDYYFRDENE